MTPKNKSLEDSKVSSTQALLSIFPTKESFVDFKEDYPKISKKSVPMFIQYAKNMNLLEFETEDEFVFFIQKHCENFRKLTPPAGYSFSELLAEITEKNSVNSLIYRLNIIAENFNMPTIHASMLSRLRKNFNPNTPKKKNILRLLAFWLGQHRPLLGWNYERLLCLHKASDSRTPIAQIEEKEGVRIAFSLQSFGDLIDSEAINWLRTTLPQCIQELNLPHINWKKINYTLTTAYLNIGKAAGPEGEPRLYGQAIREGLAIAHQISVKWLLSKHSNQERTIVIAIAAGQFKTIKHHMEALTTLEMPRNHIICMTHFARLCTRIADVKVVFNETPKKLELLNGTNLTVWAIEYFWSYMYYDFIPELLEEEMLPTTGKAYEEFKNALYFPDAMHYDNQKVLLAINKFPEDALLPLEVAKILVSRRMLHEAVKILSIILASTPFHVIARSYRMAIYRLMALNHPNPSISKNYFLRAKEESLFIEKYCFEDVETCSECGLVYYSRAIQQISIVKGSSRDKYLKGKKHLFELLDQAYKYFYRGAAISPVRNIKAECLALHTKIIKKIILTDESVLSNNTPFIDKFDIIYQTSFETWKTFGWIEEVSTKNVQNLLNHLSSTMQMHLNNILLRVYTPCIKFFSACLLWDCVPIVTVGLAKFVIAIFSEAIADVKKLEKDKVGPFANVNSYTQVQTPAHFIQNTQNILDQINKLLGDDLTRDDQYQIDRKTISSLQLSLLYLTEFCDSKLLLDQ